MNIRLTIAAVTAIYCPIAESAPLRLIDFAPSATTITFETGTTDLPTIPGVHFPYEIGSRPAEPHMVGGIAGFVNLDDPTEPFFRQAFSNLSGPEGLTDLAIEFDDPVQGVGGWIFPSAFGRRATAIDFRILDSAGNLLEHSVVTLSTDLDVDPVQFTGLMSDAGIRRAEWRIVGDLFHGGFHVDNVVFGEVRPVPLPATGWFAAAAFGGLVWRARPRRRLGTPRA